MPYEIRPVDITTIKCDGIVNSLGVLSTINQYGSICKNIIKASSEPAKLKETISSWEKEANPGKIFLTKSFGLPAKNILHIVTPYFSQDPQMFALEYVYKLAFTMAVKKKWNHLAIPIIGTGANGYPHSYVLKMVKALLDAFSNYNSLLKITVCMPVISPEDYEKKFDEKEVDKSIKDYFKENKNLGIRVFKYDEYTFEDVDYQDVDDLLHYSDKILIRDERYMISTRQRREKGMWQSSQKAFLDEKQILLDGGKRPTKVDFSKLGLFTITNYIETYIGNRYDNESDRKLMLKHVNEIVSGDSNSTSLKAKHNNEEKRTTVSKPMLMRYILALHMSKKEADDLLGFCEKTFAPAGVSKADKVYKYLIEHQIYDIYEVNGLCLKENVDQIFAYIK